ncbi:MAG: copper resistance protein [Amycolatopsis sp.]|uniref:copper resistance CopC family protein n=1 Tax=Amycolatopsis sp. TaxID=37632 RepID=UPI0026058C83|nr:copper resistance CopC family protein [Amycolatopsis sp.]MCU1682679.1 copper resistance protein [Amycolatopsis sp.]
MRLTRNKALTTGAAVLLSALFLLTDAPAASAHSVLMSSIPAKDSALVVAPAQVVLEFNEPLSRGFTELSVIGPDGKSHWETGAATITGDKLGNGLRPLGPAGQYTMNYHVISADGHPVSGSVPFTLTVAGPKTATPLPASAVPPSSAGPFVAEVAAPATTDSAAASGTVPLWPWILGAVVLLAAGVLIARRIGRGPTTKDG